MNTNLLEQAAVPPVPKKKRLCSFVIYTPSGEHIMIDCDRLEQTEKRVKLYNFERDETEGEDEKGYEDLIAVFYISNIVGWEQIR